MFSTLLENIISFVFPALKVTFQVLAQEEIFSRSLFSCWAVSLGSCPLAINEQSSAKIKISLSRPSTMSLMYIIKSSGPSRDPWGTPASIFRKDDLMPSTTTHCFLLDRYSSKSVKTILDIPICSSFAKRPLCHTLSKAELISRKTPWLMFPLPQLVLIWCIMYNNWEIVESPFK